MNRKGIVFIACMILSFMILTGCGAGGSTEPEGGNSQGIDPEEDNEIMALDVLTIENEEDQLVFDISMNDFIKSYNSRYRRDAREDYLPPAHEWPFYNTMAIHSDNETLCYRFSEDEKIRSIPEISIFTPATDDHIQQIMVSYDDHSYSIPTYEMYEELCNYTLKTMFPDLEDNEAAELCSQINTLADENISNVSYSSDAVPVALYHKQGAGVYPYYCIGEELRFCIIPVNEEILLEFEERGTDVYQVD